MSPRRGALAGFLAAAVGLGVAEFVAGLFRDAASPIVSVGQLVIDHVPRSVKTWAIDTFGTNDKAVLVLGTLLILMVVGVLVGVLAARGRWAAAWTMLGAVAAVGVLAVITRPSPSLAKLLPSLLGVGASALALRYLIRPGATGRAAAGDVSEADAAEPMGVDRRRFLLTGGAVAAAAAVTGGIGRSLRARFDVAAERTELALPQPSDPAPDLPTDADLLVAEAEPFITPANNFYRIDTALVVPQVSRTSWRLRIHGMVDHELELTYDDLVTRPMIERDLTLCCVSNEVGGRLIGNARWLGVPLRDILDEAGVQAGAAQIASRSIDGWTCGTPTDVVMDGRDAMLAVAMNGEPLPAQHGYPVRMVVPGLYGYVSATKWVVDIELTTWDAFDAYWIPRGWSKEGPVKLSSRIDTPRGGRSVARGVVPVAGVAWAMHRGVEAVEVRVDDGAWEPVSALGGVISDDTWRQWRYDWDAQPGEHTLAVRATSKDGEVQTEERRPVAPDGATGLHEIRVDVTG
jgi:DMSO/TMAO reductase YedYZ molybdopterin-dependent catalytic subunit